ncbi:MAG: hypothetical protein NT062_39530, partial [Proteobacteria bacterium]|nr:hypothetical protein [Pseudomonadota bacterium]
MMLRCLRFASAAALAVAGATLLGCNNVDCGAGTIERAGTCMPADVTVGDAKCGPFTMLEGDQCVPTLPPTVCDDSTTTPELDPATGVITCIGTGGGGCDATFACPAPTDATTQTICGQLFDLESGSKFRAPGAMGTPCSASTTDGPCSLAIAAYDALAFGSNPQTAPKLAT